MPLFTGVQELGKVHQEFKKTKKFDAYCHLPFIIWFYEFEFLMRKDAHYKVKRTSTIEAETISFNEGSYCKLFC
jgi:hypothetical protein